MHDALRSVKYEHVGQAFVQYFKVLDELIFDIIDFVWLVLVCDDIDPKVIWSAGVIEIIQTFVGWYGNIARADIDIWNGSKFVPGK